MAADSMAHSTCLRSISDGEQIVVPATSGTETFSNTQVMYVEWICPDLMRLNDAPDDARPDTPIEVFERIGDNVSFRTMFGSLSHKLGMCAFTQGQVITFATRYPNWLQPEGYATFFLIKKQERFFLACVYRRAVGLVKVLIDYLFPDKISCSGNACRVVVPRQALKS